MFLVLPNEHARNIRILNNTHKRTPLQGKFKNSTLVYSDLCHGQDQNQGFLISLGPSWVKACVMTCEFFIDIDGSLAIDSHD